MKVLICGPVERDEDWDKLKSKVADLNSSKHGPFDLLAVVPSSSQGSVGKPPDMGVKVLSTHSLSQALEIQVQFVQGKLPASYVSPVDLLLSHGVPQGSELPDASHIDADASTWALAMSPRYHFCSGAGFFQRAPYKNGKGKPVTRLVSLGQVGGKAKWIHAINLPKNVTLEEPQGTTPNPYAKSSSSLHKKKTHESHFAHNPNKDSKDRKRSRKAKVDRVPPRSDCWFCLASAGIERHLIAKVGEEVYVALPKGGLRMEHVLVVPISHEGTFSSFLQTSEVMDEVEQVLTNIESAFAKGGYATLITDRSLTFEKAPQRHAYLEVLPVPLAKLELAEKVLMDLAKESKLEMKAVGKGIGSSSRENLELLQSIKGDYVFIQLPGGKGFLYQPEESGVDLSDGRLRGSLLSFGRSVCCTLSSCPNMVSWKSCVLTKELEASWTKSMATLLKEDSLTS